MANNGNRLAPLRTGLRFLRIGSNAAATEQARKRMDRSFVEMVRLVDDLMDVSRISQGKLQ